MLRSFEGPPLFYVVLFWNGKSGARRRSRRSLSSNCEPRVACCVLLVAPLSQGQFVPICCPGTPLALAVPSTQPRPAQPQQHTNRTHRFSKKATALITHPPLQDESRCPTRRAHGPCRRNSPRDRTRGRYPSPGRPSLLAHAISEPPRVGSCRSRVPRYIRVHSHHLGHPEICQVAALVRLGHPWWQPQPHPARAALRRRTPDPKAVLRHPR